jgi:dipeptidyl-peptidase-4
VNRADAVLVRIAVLFVLLPIAVAAQGPSIPLSVEKIYAHGRLIGNVPSGITWSPDGKHLSYLDSGELIDLDPGTGKPHVLVSRAKLAALAGADGSEQDRDHRERYKMAFYLWAPDSNHLLFDSNGRLWLYDLHNGTGVQVGFTDTASGDDPKFSPNGEAISFVRNHTLAVIHQHDYNIPMTMVASASANGVLSGEVDWVYAEELEVRSNYAWSQDSKSLAYLQMNESQVPQYPIADWIPTHPRVELQYYPQPGDPNAEARVGVVNAMGGKTQWMKLPMHSVQDFIPRFGWIDRRTLWIETVTRDHKHRSLFFADAGTGQAHLVLEILDEKYLDDNYDMTVGNGRIILTNWSDGHNHIYLYSFDAANPGATTAKLDRQLTHGDFEVSGISAVDWAKKQVYYASNEGNLVEQQLWEVSFDGERKALTSEPGYHDGNFSPNGEAFVDTFSTRTAAPTFSLCSTEGTCKVFWSSRALEPYRLRAPEQLEVKAHNGTTLYATLLLPETSTEHASVPLIMNPYGGPEVQTVVNQWDDGLLFDELLAEKGFAVLHVDNRGMAMRGRAFAQEAYHNFGPVQLEDQLTVLDSVLEKHPQIDKRRLGWWGWSWGGTFTLYAMSHCDRFRAGVAVAPVTDWRDYDSIYTERYLSEPAQFPEGYKDFSAVSSAANLKGRLLLVHGTGDDNVHFENSVQYIQKLIENGVPYDFQIFPRKTHSLSGSEARTQLYRRILAHFEQYLKPAAE